MTINELFSKGLIETSQRGVQILHDAHNKEPEAPLLARVALVIGAWLSGIFLAYFFGLLLDDTFDTPPVATIIGAIVVTGSLFLFRKTKQLFFEQLALAINFAGTALFLYGVVEWVSEIGMRSKELTVALVAVSILCPIVFLVSRNPVQQFISLCWVFVLGWINAFDDRIATILVGVFILALALFLCSWLGRPNRFLNHSTTYAGLIAVITTLIFVSSDTSRYNEDFLATASIGIQISMVVGLAAGLLIVFQGKSKGRLAAIGILILFLGFITWAGAPGVAFAIGLMALAHAIGDRGIARLAPLMLTGFLIYFYYYLGVPLLTKSFWLMGLGAALLLACGLSFRILAPRLSR